jgi:hypothetical protein
MNAPTWRRLRSTGRTGATPRQTSPKQFIFLRKKPCSFFEKATWVPVQMAQMFDICAF